MNKYETRVLDAAEVRDTATHNSSSADFGKRGFSKGVLSIENLHNQIIACQLQGRADRGTVWQDVGAAVNAAAVVGAAPGVTSISVTVPWNRLRLQYSATVAPASGSISAWLDVAIY